jgi:putative membrane protein
MWLRAQARLTTYSGSFIEHWLQRLLYYEAPAWVFILAYSGFGLLVLAAWWYFPPQRRQRPIRLTLGRTPMPLQRTQALLLASMVLITFLVLSGVRPFDRTTWALEVFPVVVTLPLLWATYRRFPLTNLLYILIFVHACVLILGGAYTYARVPLGFWLADLLDLSRNPYDKIGHFFQGLVPAIAAREILLRGRFVRPSKMLAFIVVCIVLAISACYELIEWAAALILGQGADEFLGTQGDPWDTQSDMFLALMGACAALLALTRIHDRQLKPFLRQTPPE